MLIFDICLLLNIYGGYLGVHRPWWPIVEAHAISLFILTLLLHRISTFFYLSQLVAFSAEQIFR